MRVRFPALMFAVTSLLGVLTLVVATPRPAAAAGSATSAYVPLASPTRLLDTRLTTGALPSGGLVSVAVTGAAPLPAPGAVLAAVLNVTVVGPAGVGFWTVFPHDGAMPLAANLNVDEPAAMLGGGLAIPNLVTVPVGASGIVDIFSSQGGDVVVDMLGYYAPATSATSGRFQPKATPERILDTRTNNSLWQANETREVRVPGAAGASAVVLNVTVIASTVGHWVAFPSGATMPPTANLNSLGPFHLAANQVIVPVDADGDFQIYATGGGHVVIDMIGVFSGAGAPNSTDGLFVPLDTPTRFLDTRDPALNPLGGSQMLLPTWNLEVPVATHPAIGRSDVAAVVLNVTATEALRAGYLSVTPAASNIPVAKARTTATLNVNRAGQTLPNHTTVPVSARGFDVFVQSGAHVVADVAGYYVGAPAQSFFGFPQNENPIPPGCVGFATTAVSAVVRGTSAGTVAIAQQRLLDLGFWNAGPDGSYGLSTAQAVMAFQKWSGLPATSVIDEATAGALNTTPCRPTTTIAGDLFEVDKTRQLGLFVRRGAVLWVLNVSTGNGRDYDEENRRFPGQREIGVAVTPSGSFNIYRVSDQARYEGTLGSMYRPRFVVGGVAVHGSPSIPNYPASHGCIRVSNPAMDMIWATNLLPMGSRVVIHD
ncbi:MAG TPA: L,D-transpeptidase family protein [Ilumatobacteraceae bacterium]